MRIPGTIPKPHTTSTLAAFTNPPTSPKRLLMTERPYSLRSVRVRWTRTKINDENTEVLRSIGHTYVTRRCWVLGCDHLFQHRNHTMQRSSKPRSQHDNSTGPPTLKPLLIVWATLRTLYIYHTILEQPSQGYKVLHRILCSDRRWAQFLSPNFLASPKALPSCCYSSY